MITILVIICKFKGIRQTNDIRCVLDERWQLSDYGKKYTIQILANAFCRNVNCRYNGSSRVVYFMYFRQKVENSTFWVVLNKVGGTVW